MPDPKYMIRKSRGLDEIKEIESFLSKWCSNDGHILEYFMRGVSSRPAKCLYLLYEQDQLAGLISAWKSEFTPFVRIFPWSPNLIKGRVLKMFY